jgi:hypothetical protein
MQIATYNYEHPSWIRSQENDLLFILTGKFDRSSYQLNWQQESAFSLEKLEFGFMSDKVKDPSATQLRNKAITWLDQANMRVQRLKNWEVKGIKLFIDKQSLNDISIERTMLSGEEVYQLDYGFEVSNSHIRDRSNVSGMGLRVFMRANLELVKIVSNIPMGISSSFMDLTPKEDTNNYTINYTVHADMCKLLPYYIIEDVTFDLPQAYSLPAVAIGKTTINNFRSSNEYRSDDSLKNNQKEINSEVILPTKINLYHQLEESEVGHLFDDLAPLLSSQKTLEQYQQNGGYLFNFQSGRSLSLNSNSILRYLDSLNVAFRSKESASVLNGHDFFPTTFLSFIRSFEMIENGEEFVEFIFGLSLPLGTEEIDSINTLATVDGQTIIIRLDQKGIIRTIDSTILPITKIEKVPFQNLIQPQNSNNEPV